MAQRVAAGLAKIGLALKHRAWQEAGPRGITPTQGQVLAVLHNHPQGLSLTAIAEQLAVTAPTASDAVRVLTEKGLMRKERDAEDGRSIRVLLTAEGRRLAEAAAGWPDFLAAAVDTLAPEEQAVFLRALVKMIRELQERGEIPVARMCVGCRFFRPNVHPDRERPHHCAYVDAPFGDRSLRVDCADYEDVPAHERTALWEAFVTAS
ncbi:MAG: MarR family winged helix-turn-helix transcriptional regulator [Dehalococcoidia bacterium]